VKYCVSLLVLSFGNLIWMKIAVTNPSSPMPCGEFCVARNRGLQPIAMSVSHLGIDSAAQGKVQVTEFLTDMLIARSPTVLGPLCCSLSPNLWKLGDNQCLCFKPLSFGVTYHTAINTTA
jgi:hypothetical protein